MPYNPHEELYSDKLSIELTDEQLQETIDQGLQTVQQIQEAGKNLPQIIEPTSATAEEPQQPPEEVQFQTWHNSFKLTNADGIVLMHEGQNPFANNGQGALQSFESPFWTKYTGIPFCGNTCVPKIFGCTDSTSFNYDPLANTELDCKFVLAKPG